MAKPKHDPFFSHSLEYLSTAKSFLLQHTPAHLKAYINWEALARMDRSQTDNTLKKLHRDLIYTATLDTQSDVLLGVEHQSKPDPMMPIRYMRYDAHILEAYVKRGHTMWPLLVNILLYNGGRSPYPYLSEPLGYYRYVIDGKEQLYLFFYLVDLTQMSDRELLTHGLCAPMEVLLKHGLSGRFEEETSVYREVFRDCVDQVGDDYIVSMLTYADSLGDYEIGKKMHKFVEDIFENKQEVIMTYGQVLKREARQEGRQEGRQESKEIIAKNMLKEGCELILIQKVTGLSWEVIEKIKKESCH